MLLAPAVAEAKRVRVFAVGPKFHLSWVDSREHYRTKLFALMDKRERGPGTPLVQRDADDVASHLLGGERDLVALPEDIGLMASFVGSRGQPAREMAQDLTQSIGSLLGTYSPQLAFYGSRYPHLTGRVPQVRLLAISLTDTFGRVALETFAELADRYDVWLEAGVNMARDWRIVCRSKETYTPPPGGATCDAEDPGRVAQLVTTDEDRGYAYEATTDQPVNMALVFDPSGRLVSKQVKTYITPVELPGALDLVPGHVSRGLSALDTPVGVLGFVTSKDAWMPDVTQRMDQAGVEVLVQPEFFVNDTVRPEGMWSPDNLRASGAAALLRHPSIRTLVLPEMTGNVYDFSADAQQHIAVDPRGRAEQALVGQEPFPGFVKVQPWVVADPIGAESMAARRKRLGEAGLALLPGSGVECADPGVPAPCEGGQPEGVLWHDVEVGPRRARRRAVRTRKRGHTPFSASRAFTRVGGNQRNVALATRGRVAWAVFEAGERLVLMRSTDSGRRWRRGPDPVERGARQWWPSLSVGPDGMVWLAWTDDSSGTLRSYFAVSRDGRRFDAPQPLDAAPPREVAQLKPSIAATGAGRAFAAWVDERDPVAGETGLSEAGIFGARLVPAGRSEAARRLDGGEPAGLAATMDHAWAPTVAARGNRVLVTWLDFRTYDWRVYSRQSEDGGTEFAAERVVDHAPADVEAIADTPRAGLTRGGDALLAFTDYRKRESGSAVHQLHDVAVAAPGTAPEQIDPHGAAQVSSFAPALLTDASRPLVAWQDHPRGDGDITIRALGPPGRVLRVDDAGTRPWNAWRPALAALPGGRVLAAWEDDRDGVTRIRFARARVGDLR